MISIRQADELKILNNLVSGYFDLAEINAIEHKPMYMSDYINQLDAVLSSCNRKLLTGAGSVNHEEAFEKARTEYRKYQANTLSPVEEAYLESIKTVEKTAKKRQRNKNVPAHEPNLKGKVMDNCVFCKIVSGEIPNMKIQKMNIRLPLWI